MKKLVNRITYNTNTAELVAEKSGGEGEYRIKESLYKDRNGTLFIWGEGGTLTRWNGGENIIVVDKDYAREWRKGTK